MRRENSSRCSSLEENVIIFATGTQCNITIFMFYKKILHYENCRQVEGTWINHPKWGFPGIEDKFKFSLSCALIYLCIIFA